MKIRHTLIQLTTTVTLAAGLLNAGSGAFAARLAGNSIGSSIDCSIDCAIGNSTQDRVVPTSSATTRWENHAKKYEPDPNGNPTSDGTGTR